MRPARPSTPARVRAATWKYVARKTVHEFIDDGCPDLAAGLTYHAVLSLFPALLALVALLGIFGQADQTTSAILDVVESVAPGQIADLLREPIEEVVSERSAGVALVIGIAIALWTASGYVRSLSRGMNRIYEVEEGRPFLKLLLTMLGMTVVLVILVAIVGLILAVTGPLLRAIGNLIGLGATAVAIWDVAKWPVLLVLAIGMLALLYFVSPNVTQPKFRWISMGASLALIVMASASVGFGVYVSNFGNYNRTYGAIGGVIVLLLWIWIMNLAILLGAEFNSEIERGRQLQAGMPAEKKLQLPPRDTSRIDQNHDKEEKIIIAGRELRERFSTDQDFSAPAEEGKRKDDQIRA